MSIVQAIVLGLVQGLTEFLPVSSSGHLVLVPELAGWEQPGLPFFVLLHAATLLALVVYFRRELVVMAARMLQPGPPRVLVGLMALATLPAAVLGYAFEDWFEQAFGNSRQVALQLVATGLILAGAQWLSRRRPPAAGDDLRGVEGMAGKVSWRAALAMGLAQAAAIAPGISRSGVTIAAGLVSGLSRAMAARFSFLMSIPILIGTSAFEIPQLSAGSVGPGAMAAGFLASAISGYAAIAGMIALLQRRGLAGFAAYCILAGSAAFAILT